ncbi:MAG: hypothetical protein PHE53_01155 [Thermoguttaceae bacterium]|nr:hypothetical protein [Thermoguttaceae bacterium]
MTPKKILLLGGSFFQVPSVQTAKRLGYYTITCDYLPDNPGHRFADAYYNVSTTDMHAVLELAKSLKIDGIVCYASDPAAPTAAYVAEKLGLPGNPYDSVMILSTKDRFRQYLARHGFQTPQSGGYGCYEEAREDIGRFVFPVMVKPVDSSGSKGVSKIDSVDELFHAVEYALGFSRGKRIVIEEFVENHGPQVIGDGISWAGNLVFRAFGSHIFNRGGGSPFVPAGGCWPYDKPQVVHQAIHDEIQRLLTCLEMQHCGYNFEVRLDASDHPILMEIGCRNGGNMIPQVLQYATGVDMTEFVIRSAMGEDCSDYTMAEPNDFWAYYVVHSSRPGILKKIEVDEKIQRVHLVQFWQMVHPGESVLAFTGAQGTLGTMALRFGSMSEMHDKMSRMDEMVRVIVEE